MVKFQRENLEHIRRKFEAKTGVELNARANARRSWRAPLILAAALAGCLTITAFAYTLFSDLEGDELCLSSVYQGDGVVSVTVENRSDKTLKFQQDLKLVRWTTGEELPATGKVAFRDTEISPPVHRDHDHRLVWGLRPGPAGTAADRRLVLFRSYQQQLCFWPGLALYGGICRACGERNSAWHFSGGG